MTYPQWTTPAGTNSPHSCWSGPTACRIWGQLLYAPVSCIVTTRHETTQWLLELVQINTASRIQSHEPVYLRHLVRSNRKQIVCIQIVGEFRAGNPHPMDERGGGGIHKLRGVGNFNGQIEVNDTIANHLSNLSWLSDIFLISSRANSRGLRIKIFFFY